MNRRVTSPPLVNGSAFCARVVGDKVFVEERRRMMDEPEEMLLRWPAATVRRSHPLAEVEDGAPVRIANDGFHGSGFSLHVRQGVDATTSSRRVGPPKVQSGSATRYRDWRWEKMTKSGRWVPAE